MAFRTLVSESLLTVNGGNASQFKLDVVNETEHNIVLGKRTCLGRIELVRSVTPMDVRFKTFPGENKENQNEESKSNSELFDSVKVNVDVTSSVSDQDTAGSKDHDFSEIDFDGLKTIENRPSKCKEKKVIHLQYQLMTLLLHLT